MSPTVADYAAHRVLTLSPTEPIREAAARLAQAEVTGAPVVDKAGHVVGVLSLTDLVTLELYGRDLLHKAGPDDDAPRTLTTDVDTPVADVMTQTVQSASPGEPLREAARRMVAAKVHRLVVLDAAGHVRGILSTLDVMRAVAASGLQTPALQYATRTVDCVERGTPVSEAMARLLATHHHGMPVTENGWPIGLLTQTELVAAAPFAPSTPVEQIASSAVLTLPDHTALSDAAALGIHAAARRLLLVQDKQLTGILVSLDFARAFAEA